MAKDNRFSILYDYLDRCCVCGSSDRVAIHEVFFGAANRKKSIKYGCCIPLCGPHHNLGTDGIHFNHDLDIKFKKIMEKAWIKEYCDGSLTIDEKLDEFRKVFNRNYLDEEELYEKTEV